MTFTFQTYVEVSVEVCAEWDVDAMVLKSVTVNEDAAAAPDILPALNGLQRAMLRGDARAAWEKQQKD